MCRRVLCFYLPIFFLLSGVAFSTGTFIRRHTILMYHWFSNTPQPVHPNTTDKPLRKTQAISHSPAIPTPQPRSASMQDLLNLPEDKIDIGLVALTLAKEIYPDIDVAAYSARIDALAEQVRQLAGGSQGPDWRVRCLNTTIYLNEGYHGSRDAVFTRNPEYFYINRLLDTKQGNCVTMPLLYVAVAQRLGWPVYPVTVPDHFFVRYVDPALDQQNIEATSGGAYVSDERYAKEFTVSKLGRDQGTYLRTMTYREFLGELTAINAIRFGQNGQMPRAITYLKLAAELNPRSIGAWANLTSVHRVMANRSNGTEAGKYLALAAKYSKKLDELGFVHPNDVPIAPSMGGAPVQGENSVMVFSELIFSNSPNKASSIQNPFSPNRDPNWRQTQ